MVMNPIGDGAAVFIEQFCFFKNSKPSPSHRGDISLFNSLTNLSVIKGVSCCDEGKVIE